MPACAGLLIEPKGSRLELLKYAFNALKFIRRLSWFISSLDQHFRRSSLLKCALQTKVVENSL